MLRGLWTLTWIELKVFMREPLGAFGSILIPVLLFVMFGRLGRTMLPPAAYASNTFFRVNLPVLVAVLITLNAVLSLVAIISIYREGGILKRLRATPLRPAVILAAHVLVKLVFTGITLLLMALAGRRFYPMPLQAHVANFALAVGVTTVAILCMGFVIASMVGAARFAQLIGSSIFYPMLAISGMFVPLSSLPRP